MTKETEYPGFWETMRRWLLICWESVAGDKTAQVILGTFVAAFELVALAILLATECRQWEVAIFVAIIPACAFAGLVLTLVVVACVGWLIIPRQKQK